MWLLELIWKSRKQDTYQHLSSWPQNDSLRQELCGTGSNARNQLPLTPPDASARRPFSVLGQCLVSHTLPTLVTRRDWEMRCSQSTAQAPLVGCWLLQNNKWRLPAEPSTSPGQGFKAGNLLPVGIFSKSQRLLLPWVRGELHTEAGGRNPWEEKVAKGKCLLQLCAKKKKNISGIPVNISLTAYPWFIP